MLVHEGLADSPQDISADLQIAKANSSSNCNWKCSQCSVDATVKTSNSSRCLTCWQWKLKHLPCCLWYSFSGASCRDGVHPDTASSGHQWRALHLHQRPLEALPQEGGVCSCTQIQTHTRSRTLSLICCWMFAWTGFLSQRQLQQPSGAGPNIQTGTFWGQSTTEDFLKIHFRFTSFGVEILPLTLLTVVCIWQ